MVKEQLQYVKRDFGYIGMFLETGDVELTDKQMSHIRTIREVFDFYNEADVLINAIENYRQRVDTWKT